jgi:hypothetical protein
MKDYPSIPAAGFLLARSTGWPGRPFVAFDKLDGSNIRAEWDRKKGWGLFGSRKRLLDAGHPLLGQAIGLIRDGYGDGLARVLVDDPTFRGRRRRRPTSSSWGRTASPASTTLRSWAFLPTSLSEWC